MGTVAFPYDADVAVTGPHPSPPITIIFQQIGGRYSVNVSATKRAIPLPSPRCIYVN